MRPLLLVLLLACTAAPEVEAPVEVAEDRAELLTDVQHLMGEAAAMHAAGRLPEAAAAWDRGYGLWQRHLAGPLRTADAAATVSLEYELGRLRVELHTARGRPKAVAARADRLLEARRPELVAAAAVPPPATSAVPTP
jgi:hypothetical protein